ncbi:hypothetical protein STRDD11_00488 [Streptococcus sp. DD11]|nr:hypothetical protein STRDD11_00488 [Streptococcus sp. DD11]
MPIAGPNEQAEASWPIASPLAFKEDKIKRNRKKEAGRK